MKVSDQKNLEKMSIEELFLELKKIKISNPKRLDAEYIKDLVEIKKKGK